MQSASAGVEVATAVEGTGAVAVQSASAGVEVATLVEGTGAVAVQSASAGVEVATAVEGARQPEGAGVVEVTTAVEVGRQRESTGAVEVATAMEGTRQPEGAGVVEVATAVEGARQAEGARSVEDATAVDVARQRESTRVVEVATAVEGAGAVEVTRQPEGSRPVEAKVRREAGAPAALLRGSTWSGHCSLGEVRKAGPCCQGDPGPMSARETVPLVPRSAGLRTEGTWVTGSSTSHLGARSSSSPVTSETLFCQYGGKAEPDFERAAITHSESVERVMRWMGVARWVAARRRRRAITTTAHSSPRGMVVPLMAVRRHLESKRREEKAPLCSSHTTYTVAQKATRLESAKAAREGAPLCPGGVVERGKAISGVVTISSSQSAHARCSAAGIWSSQASEGLWRRRRSCFPLRRAGESSPRGSNQPWRRERVVRRERGLVPRLIASRSVLVSVLATFLPLTFSKKLRLRL